MIKDNSIRWKLKLTSPKERVYHMLSTGEGRASFWAESAIEKEGFIHFVFPNGQEYLSRIINNRKCEEFSIDYFGSVATFMLKEEKEHTILSLLNQDVDGQEINEVNAGWVSVLMSLKAACDYNIDLRNHSSECHWDNGYVEN
ncbi:MAG: hypothetical protein HKN68_22910 [Saprospiraceae bacterium]|nr:hypothetical protein [Saprospiraceae bacterium]